MRDSRINGEYRLFHTSVNFFPTSLEEQRGTTTESLRGTGYVQETDEGQTKETRGPTYTFSFPRMRERNGFYRCTVITAIWRAYETLASGNPKIHGIRRHFHERWGRIHSECILKWKPTRDTVRKCVVFCIHTYANTRQFVPIDA